MAFQGLSTIQNDIFRCDGRRFFAVIGGSLPPFSLDRHEHIDEVFRLFVWVLFGVEDGHEIVVILLMAAIILPEGVEGLDGDFAVAMLRAFDILVQAERMKLAGGGFAEFEGEKAAEKRPVFVNDAMMLARVAEEAAGFAALQGHKIPFPVDAQPSRVAFGNVRDVFRADEYEELLGMLAGGFDDSNDIPRRGQTDHIGTTMPAMMTTKLNRMLAQGSYPPILV